MVAVCKEKTIACRSEEVRHMARSCLRKKVERLSRRTTYRRSGSLSRDRRCTAHEHAGDIDIKTTETAVVTFFGDLDLQQE